MRNFLISILLLGLAGCTLNVNIPVDEPLPTSPPVVEPVVVPEPVIVTQTCYPSAIDELSLIPLVNKEKYRTSNNQRGYVKALQKYIDSVQRLLIEIEIQKAKCNDNG